MTDPGHSLDDDAAARAGVGILTVSDTRTAETDRGGDLAAALAAEAGHAVVRRALVPDDERRIAETLRQWIDLGLDLVITTGGTGIMRRDVTPEAVRPLLDRELPGFSAALALLSLEDVGPRALLGRALMGAAGRTLVAVLPGSPPAVRLAMTRLILPLVPHALRELRR